MKGSKLVLVPITPKDFKEGMQVITIRGSKIEVCVYKKHSTKASLHLYNPYHSKVKDYGDIAYYLIKEEK